MRTLHETLKKYGYTKIFSDDDLASNPCMIWSYINKPCTTIIDSLILTYRQGDISSRYYREFWNRIKTEGNDCEESGLSPLRLRLGSFIIARLRQRSPFAFIS
jgi:hypothetical protein